jgi:hypothetical protein
MIPVDQGGKGGWGYQLVNMVGHMQEEMRVIVA